MNHEDGYFMFRVPTSPPSKNGDLLASDGEKNEFDWLLTPPDTPLFPSLAKEIGNTNDSIERTSLTSAASVTRSLKELIGTGLHAANGSRFPHSVASECSNSRGTTNIDPPSRISATLSKAKLPSPSSSTASLSNKRGVSQGRAISTAGQLASKGRRSYSMSYAFCKGDSLLPDVKPSQSTERAHKKSLPPRLRRWEQLMAACSTESPPNLRTTPSYRSLHRGISDVSSRGGSFRINSSPLGVENRHCLKRRTMSADKVELFELPNKFNQDRNDFHTNFPSVGRHSTNSSIVPKAEKVSGTTKGITSVSKAHGDRMCTNKLVPDSFVDQVKDALPCYCSSSNTVLYNDMDRPYMLNNCGCGSEKIARHDIEDGKKSAQISLENCNSQQLSNVHTSMESETTLHEKVKFIMEKGDYRHQVPKDNQNFNALASVTSSISGNAESSISMSKRHYMSEQGEGNTILKSNKLENSSRNMLEKSFIGPTSQSLSYQDPKHRAGGFKHGVRLPVRRQLSMTDADMLYETWRKKDFDISTSDSYSYTDSLDSSYLDNHTEKFSEDFSEADSTPHTAYSNSIPSGINYPPCYTCAPTGSAGQKNSLMHSPTPTGRKDTMQDSVCLEELRQEQKSILLAEKPSRKDASGFYTPCGGCEFHSRILDSGASVKSENNGDFLEVLNISFRHGAPHLLSTNADCENALAIVNCSLGYTTGEDIHALEASSAKAIVAGPTKSDKKTQQVQLKASASKKSITLEEATDTILFCSSIVHEIVYEAASLGEQEGKLISENRVKRRSLVCEVSIKALSRCWNWIRRGKTQCPTPTISRSSVDVKLERCTDGGPQSGTIQNDLLQRWKRLLQSPGVRKKRLEGNSKGRVLCCFS
ncbi:hypothetical protein KP509_13G056300 [Ceratopteris richardii]|nr:hypothetical protein KP509_13G056300 [Ceratopteris richardii]